ncbi:MAG: hypothetical protein QOI65_1322, partial [Thermoleophilaceae bacterium]|nr:hypothetical protein [Thermoleophilaceae bacterium]
MRGTRLLTVVLFLAALCVFAPSALAASGWYELGQNGTQFSTWTEFDLVDFGGSPLMAWHGRDPNGTGADYNKFGVFAAMFDGHPLETNPWKDVAGGTGAFFPNLSNFPSAAVVGGTLYVAAAIPSVPDDAFNPNRKIHVAKLVGSTWQDVGSPLNDPSSSGPGAGGPVIADVGGVPYVMFGEQETGAGTPIFRVKKWNGSAWVELGSGTHPLQPSVNDYAPAADFASIGGQPYVTLVDKKPLGGYNPI